MNIARETSMPTTVRDSIPPGCDVHTRAAVGIEVSRKQIESFWKKVSKGDDCWVWSGNKNLQGYGLVDLSGKQRLAHRVSWAIHNGNLPEVIFVLHHCDNPPCIRPDHLFLGGHIENTRDRVSKGRPGGRMINRPIGESNPSAKLNLKKVSEIRELRKSGLTLSAIAKIYKVSRPQIGHIVSGQHWKQP